MSLLREEEDHHIVDSPSSRRAATVMKQREEGGQAMNDTYGQSMTSTGYPQVYGSGYPVDIQFPRQESYNRLWAIPVVGLTVKAIILIPHFIVLAVLCVIVGLLQLVTWIPVLTTGQYPDWSYNLTAGLLRWSVRVNSFLFGLSDTYPAFALDD